MFLVEYLDHKHRFFSIAVPTQVHLFLWNQNCTYNTSPACSSNPNLAKHDTKINTCKLVLLENWWTSHYLNRHIKLDSTWNSNINCLNTKSRCWFCGDNHRSQYAHSYRINMPQNRIHWNIMNICVHRASMWSKCSGGRLRRVVAASSRGSTTVQAAAGHTPHTGRATRSTGPRPAPRSQ